MKGEDFLPYSSKKVEIATIERLTVKFGCTAHDHVHTQTHGGKRNLRKWFNYFSQTFLNIAFTVYNNFREKA